MAIDQTSADTEGTGALVLKDGAGSYFLVAQETLERGRVPADRAAELERLIAEQGDVQGHLGPAGIVLVAAYLGFGAMVLVGETGPEVQGTLKGIKPREQLVGGGGKPPR